MSNVTGAKATWSTTQLVMGLVASLVICALSFTHFYQDLESSTYDFRFLLRNEWLGVPEQLPSVATIDIDDLALQTHGWPFSRDRHADLVDVIHRYGARMIGFDIFFYEPSGKRLDPEEIEALEGATVDRQQLLDMVRDDDADLLAASERGNIVYLAQTFEITERGPRFAAENLRDRGPEKTAAVRELERFSVPVAERGNRLFYHAVDIDIPLIPFIRAARGIGFALPKPDHDGIVRRYRMALVYDGRVYFSLGLVMACDYLGVPLEQVRFRPGVVSLPHARFPDGRVHDLHIPVSGRCEMLVNWAGSYNDTYRHLPYNLVMDFARTEPENRALVTAKRVAARDPEAFGDEALFLARAREMGGAELDPEILLNKRSRVEFGLLVEDVVAQDPGATIEGTAERLGIAGEDAVQFADVWGQVFSEVKMNRRILEVLEETPDLPLDGVGQRLGISRLDDIQYGVGVLRDRLRRGGIGPEDHPLFFEDLISSAGLHGESSADRIVTPEDIAGAVFFYGLTATGSHDLNPTPFGAREAMLGAHVNVFNTVLTSNFLARVPTWGNIAVMLVLGVLIGFVVPRFKAVPGAALVGVILGLYVVVAFLLFTNAGLWVDVLGPISTLILGYLTITLYNYVQKEKEKEQVQGAFGHYLDPKVVNQLVENPSLVTQLGGDQRVMTVFFSDVASFSTIAENLTAVELVELLNEYLSEMCDVIALHNGTIDKFEGDAIMAFWGAPIPSDDHARAAVLAAIEMQRKCSELRVKWTREGQMEELRELWAEQGRGEFFRVRMGINTSEMVVGNLGSHSRVDYTVMGDGVNLASRLEGAGKAYGITTLVSEYTLRAAGDIAEVRPLDSIRVVGKDEPVRVYEVLGLKGEVDRAKMDVVDLYTKGYDSYVEQKWDEAEAHFTAGLALDPEDGPCAVFLERCRAFKLAPPPEGWDAVHNLDSK